MKVHWHMNQSVCVCFCVSIMDHSLKLCYHNYTQPSDGRSTKWTSHEGNSFFFPIVWPRRLPTHWHFITTSYIKIIIVVGLVRHTLQLTWLPFVHRFRQLLNNLYFKVFSCKFIRTQRTKHQITIQIKCAFYVFKWINWCFRAIKTVVYVSFECNKNTNSSLCGKTHNAIKFTLSFMCVDSKICEYIICNKANGLMEK